MPYYFGKDQFSSLEAAFRILNIDTSNVLFIKESEAIVHAYGKTDLPQNLVVISFGGSTLIVSVVVVDDQGKT